MSDTYGGYDIDELGNLLPPKTPNFGTTLNSGPMEFATPQGGPLITTPSTYANPTAGDPYNPRGPLAQPPPRGGQLTPFSPTGTPAPGIRTSLTAHPDTSPRLPGWSPKPIFPGGPVLGAAVALANAPTDYGASLNKAFNESAVGKALNSLTGFAGQGLGQPDLPMTQTKTQTQPQQQTKTPVIAPPIDPPPPFGPAPPGPPNNLPPFNRGPIPPYLGHPAANAPMMQRHPGAPGGGGAPPAPAMTNLQPTGEYFATTGNARTPVWQPGGFASPPAQHFQTPLTPMFGPGQWIGGQQQQAAAAPQTGNARGGGGSPQTGGYGPGGTGTQMPKGGHFVQLPDAVGSPHWVPGPPPRSTAPTGQPNPLWGKTTPYKYPYPIRPGEIIG